MEESEARFVFIVSFPRSGTTALGSLLVQPGANVNYFGQFFSLQAWNRNTFQISRHYPFFATKFIMGIFLQRQSWSPFRFEGLKLDPVKALTALSRIPGTHVFKIFPNHVYDDSLEAMINKFRPDIVFVRRNHLDRLVSHKKAKAIGIWHGVMTESVNVEIEEKELRDFIDGYQAFYQKVYQWAASNSCNFLDVQYETLFEPTNTEGLLRFILANNEKASGLNLKPRTLKQDTNSTSQQNFLQKTSSEESQKKISDYDFPKIS